MADHLAHLSYLTVESLSQRNRQLLRLPVFHCRAPLHLGWRRPAAVDEHPAPELLDHPVVRSAGDDGFVDALDFVPGVCELFGEVAVGGEEQQSFAVVVEAADGVDIADAVAKQV